MAMTGNPLLGMAGGDMSLKRRWYEDTVFRNQARGEPKAQRRFINDTGEWVRASVEAYCTVRWARPGYPLQTNSSVLPIPSHGVPCELARGDVR